MVCPICSGRGQMAPGQRCPVCTGTGMTTAAAVARYQRAMNAAALEGATARLRSSAGQAADTWIQEQAGARHRITEAAARAEEAAARLEAAAARWEPPDPTDPPPGVILPAGMGGEIMYYDSLLVRQLDVWGNLNAASLTPIFLAPSGDVTGAQDAARINAVIGSLPVFTLTSSPLATTAAGTIYLGPGTWYIGSTVNVPPWVTIIGAGPGTLINSLVNGDTFFMQNPVPRGGAPIFQNVFTGPSGGFRDMRIDGTGAGANGCGIHTDSLPERLLIDQVWIQNFTGASAVGLHMSNSLSFTENFKIRAFSLNNTTACFMEKIAGVPGGSESFRYGDFEMHIVAEPGQTGMVMQGAHFFAGRLVLKGNYAASSSAGPANWAHLYLSPTGIGGSPTYAQIQSCEVQLFAEIDLGPLAFNPQTIKFGDVTQNSLTQCYGAMLFQNGFVNSNATPQCLSFWGMIGNDTVMQGVVQQPNQVTQPDFTTAPQAISTPAIPLSGVPLTNNNASAGQTADVLVYIQGGTFTAPVQVNGVNAGDTNARFFYVPSGQTIKLTYSVAPTSWLWVGV